MKPFFFKGNLSASKSILNRLLIIQSYEQDLKILGDSAADDVVEMKAALEGLQHNSSIDCGAAGTTFRFFALRISRNPGTHKLTGSKRLFSRPQAALTEILSQFGVSAKFEDGQFIIESSGWKKPQTAIRVDRSQSSQFASALLLNAWDLDFLLEAELVGDEPISEGYLELTYKMVTELGLKVDRTKSGGTELWRIHPHSKVKPGAVRAEMDLSSAFAVAAIGAVSGEVILENFPENSLQPDSIFPEILSKMGVLVEKTGPSLRIVQSTSLKGVEQDLGNSPDLFPVLAVLCAFAEGRSRLYGAPQLVHKESSRIDTTAKLLEKLGCSFEKRTDGMIIHGLGKKNISSLDEFEFDPDQDHRLAMAAAVAKSAGARIRILHPGVVNKSFPEFWSLLKSGGDIQP